MGRIRDLVFDREYYISVTKSFKEAKTLYKDGYDVFIQQRQSELPKEDYEYKKYIYENFSEIIRLNKLITTAKSTENKYPLGTKAFRKKYNILSTDTSFPVYELIAISLEEIRELDALMISFSKIENNYSEAIRYLIGNNHSLEDIKYICQNQREVERVNKCIRKFTQYKERYPLSISSYQKNGISVDSLIYLTEQVNEDSIRLSEEYFGLKALNSSFSKDFFANIQDDFPCIRFTKEEISRIRSIISEYKKSFQEHVEQTRFLQLTKKCYETLLLSFGKSPESFSRLEKKNALSMESMLITQQQVYFLDSHPSFLIPQVGDYLEWLVNKAKQGRACPLPKNIDDFNLTIAFYRYLSVISLNDASEVIINVMMPDAPEMEDLSVSAIKYRKERLSYLKQSYGDSYQSCDKEITIERDQLLKEVFNYPGYGTEVSFPDDYSVSSCYDLEVKLEELGATYSDTYAYIKKNLPALRQYNKAKTGKETWYIDDFIRIASKEKELIEFINAYQEEKDLRDTVRSIKSSYSLGFDEYKRFNCINFNVDTASIQQLQRVIDSKELIKEYHTIEVAKGIISKYPEAVRERFSHIHPSYLSFDIAQRLCNCENDLRTLQLSINAQNATLNRIREATRDWNSVAGVPHYFFYWYYPSRFINISPESERARRLIYSFKNGESHKTVFDIVTSKMRATFTVDDIAKFTFVCIPASTVIENECRFSSFSNELCNALRMKDAFPHIHITKEKVPSRLGGTEDAEFAFDDYFFKNSLVVLFDDVVTKGHSMGLFKRYLEELGATVVCAFSIGRTYSDYYGDDRQPHPWTGTL